MRPLMIILTSVLLLTSSTGCKKLIEDKKRDVLMDVITDGRWIIKEYLEGSTDITSDFTGFEFLFKEDGTVDAIHGTDKFTGTWSGDLNTSSITSDFGNAGEPLGKLTGQWVITSSDVDFVKAYMSGNGSNNKVHLIKKP